MFNEVNKIYEDLNLEKIIEDKSSAINNWGSSNLFIFKYRGRIIGYNTGSCMLIELEYDKVLDCYFIKRRIKPYRYSKINTYNYIRDSSTGKIQNIVKYTHLYFDISKNIEQF